MRNMVVALVGVSVFAVASYNMYGFFQNRKLEQLQKQAVLEQQRQKRLEEQRQAELQQQVKLNELALQKQKAEAELLERKIEAQERLQRYKALKNAQREAKDNQRLQRRIESARKLSNPEGLPARTVQGIKQATYLTIRNNPKDYIGNYQSNSLLSQRAGKLTSGGANGLMLFAMVSADLKAIDEVISIGHDVNQANKLGYTPLMFASAYNTDEVIEHLLAIEGVDKFAIEYASEGNALHIAARYNPKPEVFDVLVRGGFDIEARDKDGNTALLVASKYNQNLQVVERLVELGADIKASDKAGNVAYNYAVERTDRSRGLPLGQFEFISEEYEGEILRSLTP